MGTVNKASLNTVHISLPALAFSSLGFIPRNGIAGLPAYANCHMAILHLIFVEFQHHFPQQQRHSTFSPATHRVPLSSQLYKYLFDIFLFVLDNRPSIQYV